jgi:hypothetical protein
VFVVCLFFVLGILLVAHRVGRTDKGAGGYRSRHACSRVRRAIPGPSRSSPLLCNRVSGLLCSRLSSVLVALLEGVGFLLFPVRFFLSVCSLVALEPTKTVPTGPLLRCSRVPQRCVGARPWRLSRSGRAASVMPLQQSCY